MIKRRNQEDFTNHDLSWSSEIWEAELFHFGDEGKKHLKGHVWYLPGGPMVKNLPCSAGMQVWSLEGN